MQVVGVQLHPGSYQLADDELAHTSPNSVMTLKDSVLLRGGISFHDLAHPMPGRMVPICLLLQPLPRWTRSVAPQSLQHMGAWRPWPYYLGILSLTM